MNKAELIRHEIEKRRVHNLAIGNPLFSAMAEEDIELLSFIDSTEEEPVSEEIEVSYDAKINEAHRLGREEGMFLAKTMFKEPVNEELEEAAKRYATEGDEISGLYIIDVEADAFKAGAKWQKQQMMAKAFDFTEEHNTACVLASECLRVHGWFNRERDFNDLFRHLSCVDELFEGKFRGKTKVIVIKED